MNNDEVFEVDIKDIKHIIATWIKSQRDEWRNRSEPLPKKIIDKFSIFFPLEILTSTQYLLIDDLHSITLPTGYIELKSQMGSVPLDLNLVRGLTLDDLLVIKKSTLKENTFEDVMFRELVHVFQFKELGIEGFVDAYIDGWTKNGKEHQLIPLEVEAERVLSLFKMKQKEIEKSNAFLNEVHA